MTLLSEIQGLLERTYAGIGVNLEQCLIGPVRCSELTAAAGPSARGMAPSGRTFLRLAGDRLYLAVFYADPVIGQLERHDPRRVLNEHNISPLITFVEEIAHCIQAGLLFHEGERDFSTEEVACNLEAQAKIDTYLVLCKLAHVLCGGCLPPAVRQWLGEQLFDSSADRFGEACLRSRYGRAQELAYRFLRRLEGVPLARRQFVLREFRRLSWRGKQDWLGEATRGTSGEEGR